MRRIVTDRGVQASAFAGAVVAFGALQTRDTYPGVTLGLISLWAAASIVAVALAARKHAVDE